MPKASIATRAQGSRRGRLPSLDREGARNYTEQFSDQSIGLPGEEWLTHCSAIDREHRANGFRT
jgi:hypothetical protein